MAAAAQKPPKSKPYVKLVEEAIVALREIDLQLNLADPTLKNGKKRYKGATMQAVSKFILQNDEFPDQDKAIRNIKAATKRMLAKNSIVNINGKGLTGRFKLAEPEKKVKQPLKKTAKKTVAKAGSSKAGPKGAPVSQSESESDNESESDDEDLPVEKSKAKPKGRLPKAKVDSKVVKKAKATRPIADLTKPPPKTKAGKKQAAKVDEPSSPKPAKAGKPVPDLLDEILQSDQSDKENKPADKPVKKTATKTKVAKKTKVAPRNAAKKAESSGPESEAELPAAVIKPKPKGKGKAAKKAPVKKPVFTDSGSATETMSEKE